MCMTKDEEYFYVLQRGVIGVLTGLTRTLSRWSYAHEKIVSVPPQAGSRYIATRKGHNDVKMDGAHYLLKILRIQKNPAELDHLRRVLRDIHPMLIARCGNMDDNVAIQVRLMAQAARHLSRVRVAELFFDSHSSKR
ncbi:hypothetical protein GP486_007568 [Trichoglossum hirsutum]|uniref:Uncharacterized protein n=1 Tax=Trichoglossum hirsutum TaxID=265104 RepID=A0A9P8L7K9_9PEZI|nr:hypothetical protein GP486_007568 [Trichoglossum hirsutum]